MKDIIYTNIGAIVVALNPFNFKIPWYMDPEMKKYLAEGDKIELNLPHSWAQAHNTYNEMVMDKEDQCVLISGESGAGKTEATKIVMKYLACISINKGSEEQKQAGMQVGVKLARCSPFLEAFGNARTVRNENSSRFGKFMKIKFDLDSRLIGAFTIKYLLEKSRIITASKGERVYHAFYIAVRGKYAAKYGLVADTEYKSINAGQTLNNGDFNTSKDFDEVVAAMETVGLSETDIDGVWRGTCAILSLLNVGFVADGDYSIIDEKYVPFLSKATELFRIDLPSLQKELLSTTLELKGEKTVVRMKIPNAIDGRDALCKATYDLIFGWLVEKCNESCDVPDTGGNWIGLLDIFGFEDFEYNSFEQICINLANETLQNHYNGYIFSKDMDECRAEGIDVTEITCPDNMPCLLLVTAKGGILSSLDEECMITTGTDAGFLEKISMSFAAHPFFERKKLAKTSFIVRHYAGNVSYEVAGWLEKNRDNLKDTMKLIMRASSCDFVKQLLPEPLGPDAKKSKVTVGSFFKNQVGALMDLINSTNPHWIRCVKPHPARKPLMFDGLQTMNQLESSGVLGTVKIRKAGYPIRLIFEKFIRRYGIITGNKSQDPREYCINILKACNIYQPNMSQVGKTKAFLKSEAYPLMEKMRNACLLTYTTLCQRVGQGFMTRDVAGGHYWTLRVTSAVKCIQADFRDFMARTAPVRAERARVRAEMQKKRMLERAELGDEEDEARAVLWDEDMMLPMLEMIAAFQAEMGKFLRQRLDHMQSVEAINRSSEEEAEAKERRNITIEYDRASSLAGLWDLARVERVLRGDNMEVAASELAPLVVAHYAMLLRHQEGYELKMRNDIISQEKRMHATLHQSATIRYAGLRMEEEHTFEQVWRTHIEELEALNHLFHVKFQLDAQLRFLQGEEGTYSEANYRKLIMYEERLRRKELVFFLCFIRLHRQEAGMRNAMHAFVELNAEEIKKRHNLCVTQMRAYRVLWEEYEPTALDIKEMVHVRTSRIDRREKKLERLRALRSKEQETMDLASDQHVNAAREKEIRLILALEAKSEETIMQYGLGSLWSQYAHLQTKGTHDLRGMPFQGLVRRRQHMEAFADYATRHEPDSPLWVQLLASQRESLAETDVIARRATAAKDELHRPYEPSPQLTRQALSNVRSDVRSPEPLLALGYHRVTHATETSPLARNVRTPMQPANLYAQSASPPVVSVHHPSPETLSRHRSRTEHAVEERSLLEVHAELQRELAQQRATQVNVRMAQQIAEDHQERELRDLHSKLQSYLS